MLFGIIRVPLNSFSTPCGIRTPCSLDSDEHWIVAAKNCCEECWPDWCVASGGLNLWCGWNIGGIPSFGGNWPIEPGAEPISRTFCSWDHFALEDGSNLQQCPSGAAQYRSQNTHHHEHRNPGGSPSVISFFHWISERNVWAAFRAPTCTRYS